MYKIAMIAPIPFFVDRGASVRVYEEAKALKKLGNDVTIFTYHLGKRVEGLKIKRIPQIPWYKKTEAGPSYHKLYLDFLLFLKSIRSINKEKFDIIHAHMYEGLAIAYLIKLIKKIPIVWDAQDVFLTEEMVSYSFIKRNSLQHRFWKKFENFIKDKSNFIITSSRFISKEMQRKLNIPKQKIYPVEDGVDTDIFYPRKINKLKEKLNLKNKKIVCYLGVLTKQQGIDYLLKAIPFVVKEIRNTHFLIIGYPIERYQKIAKKLGISKYITFTGKINHEKVPFYLSLGDIAVSPKIAVNESNGKLYYYMACGLPSVVFDYPVNREILGSLGIYTKRKDSISLANNIIKLLLNDKLRKKLSKKVREKAVEEYSWKNSAKKIMHIYAKIIQSENVKK